jgi:hypothetical protein
MKFLLKNSTKEKREKLVTGYRRMLETRTKNFRYLFSARNLISTESDEYKKQYRKWIRQAVKDIRILRNASMLQEALV